LDQGRRETEGHEGDDRRDDHIGEGVTGEGQPAAVGEVGPGHSLSSCTEVCPGRMPAFVSPAKPAKLVGPAYQPARLVRSADAAESDDPARPLGEDSRRVRSAASRRPHMGPGPHEAWATHEARSTRLYETPHGIRHPPH